MRNSPYGITVPFRTNATVNKFRTLSGRAQGTCYELTKDRVLIGRSPDCDIALSVPAMSRYHAQFVRTEDGYSFEDLGARNGSYVNGQCVNDRVPLHDGDRIHTGAVILVYRRRAGCRLNTAEPVAAADRRGVTAVQSSKSLQHRRLLSLVVPAARFGLIDRRAQSRAHCFETAASR